MTSELSDGVVRPSPEQLAISKNIRDLCSGITNISTVTAFALSLEQRGLITSSGSSSILTTNGIGEEEKCSRLLKAVLEQIRWDPTVFESFISIFSNEAALNYMAKKLSASRGESHLSNSYMRGASILCWQCMVSCAYGSSLGSRPSTFTVLRACF